MASPADVATRFVEMPHRRWDVPKELGVQLEVRAVALHVLEREVGGPESGIMIARSLSERFCPVACSSASVKMSAEPRGATTWWIIDRSSYAAAMMASRSWSILCEPATTTARASSSMSVPVCGVALQGSGEGVALSCPSVLRAEVSQIRQHIHEAKNHNQNSSTVSIPELGTFVC